MFSNTIRNYILKIVFNIKLFSKWPWFALLFADDTFGSSSFPLNDLREKVSKNLVTLNLGCRQIVSAPIFSASPYKNRLLANFTALEDLFWTKFRFLVRGGQNRSKLTLKTFYSQIPSDLLDIHFWDQKQCQQSRFIFDEQLVWETFRLILWLKKFLWQGH